MGVFLQLFKKLFYCGKFPNCTKGEGKVKKKKEVEKIIQPHVPITQLQQWPILGQSCFVYLPRPRPCLFWGGIFKASTRLFHFMSPSHFKNVFHCSFCWPVQPSWWKTDRQKSLRQTIVPSFHSNPANEAFHRSRLSKNVFNTSFKWHLLIIIKIKRVPSGTAEVERIPFIVQCKHRYCSH